MSHSLHTAAVREEWIRQLLYFDENRYTLMEKLQAYALPERLEMEQLLIRYEQTLEELVAAAEETPPPVVLVGSRVMIRFEDTLDQERFVIALPDGGSLESGSISCLSPVGRALLLSRPGDKVKIRTPEERYEVTVLEHEFAPAVRLPRPIRRTV
ncbi:GreA/GreB family elongation factor [Paenibacillus glufosinatiresistens]|uniref:GreA/GreB family elongation factor n=1 Tax=Paenibacillus glufosinatiresistens TaxID=3070657 RepID=UPI00286E9EF6|nr:GreA/GreB family elongation factor [Paenibacillus sp. YX.27]